MFASLFSESSSLLKLSRHFGIVLSIPIFSSVVQPVTDKMAVPSLKARFVCFQFMLNQVLPGLHHYFFLKRTK